MTLSQMALSQVTIYRLQGGLFYRLWEFRTFRQNHGDGRFGKKNMPKRLRLKTFAETFRMICGAYPVYARKSI